jgi:hypothetical protein
MENSNSQYSIAKSKVMILSKYDEERMMKRLKKDGIKKLLI